MVFKSLYPCDEFQGYRNRKGYGQLKFNGKAWLAHRLAWVQAYGPIPPDLCVLHRCDNPPCREVRHLFLGTKGDNNRDMYVKGRHRGRGIYSGQDHPSAKLTNVQVESIRREYVPRKVTLDDLAAKYGVTKKTIWRVLKGRRGTG